MHNCNERRKRHCNCEQRHKSELDDQLDVVIEGPVNSFAFIGNLFKLVLDPLPQNFSILYLSFAHLVHFTFLLNPTSPQLICREHSLSFLNFFGNKGHTDFNNIFQKRDDIQDKQLLFEFIGARGAYEEVWIPLLISSIAALHVSLEEGDVEEAVEGIQKLKDVNFGNQRVLWSG